MTASHYELYISLSISTYFYLKTHSHSIIHFSPMLLLNTLVTFDPMAEQKKKNASKAKDNRDEN